ncbi:hypothetical protein A8950_3700 [Dongia mobilis]|uniref:Urease accessory protein UreH-like transmembrane domain-containing protein n=1 Tax=Dongia mobilis TaxID=578943 RepID=A0A4R6WI41_9PROT|nr:sulfite exporter TauE/SafE family protein [Dongia mobilis]TDQ77548.1 hypothetical protein A8950_3700 [Dongia mobilis]
MSDGISAFAALAAHCQDVAVAHGPVFLGLLVAGFVGSAGHCVGMCGPFVLAQSGGRMARVPLQGGALRLELRRLQAGLALPYQVGRATTYILAGALLAAPFGVASHLTDWPYLAPSLLAFAAIIFAWQAWRGFGLPSPRLWGDALPRLAGPLLQAPFGWRGFVLGLLLGFMPCGLLYGALAAAAATADPLAAAIGMAGFVLGTIPALGAVGYLGGRAALRWRPLAQRALPFVAGFNACILLAMALRDAL